jgi:type VI protein secretion system component VasF
MNIDDKSREQEIDRWLDDALSQYSKAEPRAGLEGRVLARLAEGRQESSRKLPWWRVLAFTAAAIVAIAFFWHAHTGLTQLRQNPVAKVSAPATRMEPGTNGEPSLDESAIQTLRARKPLSVVPKEVHRVGRANAIQQAALPKLEQFPSRRNLSQQESLLARHLTEQSNKEALLETAATRAEVDLSIDSLEISSLQVTDIQISDSKTN